MVELHYCSKGAKYNGFLIRRCLADEFSIKYTNWLSSLSHLFVIRSFCIENWELDIYALLSEAEGIGVRF